MKLAIGNDHVAVEMKQEIKKYLEEQGTLMQSWAPFTEGRKRIFEEPVLKEIAAAHDKSAAQVALKYLLSNGIPVIPKSSKPARMRENLELFDFELSQEEMQAIPALDRQERYENW